MDTLFRVSIIEVIPTIDKLCILNNFKTTLEVTCFPEIETDFVTPRAFIRKEISRECHCQACEADEVKSRSLGLKLLMRNGE